MGLIQLKTNLKSLKFGSDRLGGGSSNQPYIVSPIPEGNSAAGILGEDFILRGGVNALLDSATDVVRLGKMFGDLKSPNGLLFIAKQQLLSRLSVRTEASNGLLNDGAYSPLNTLAQAGIVAIGGHLKKQGLNPFGSTGAYSPSLALYANAVQARNEPYLKISTYVPSNYNSAELIIDTNGAIDVTQNIQLRGQSNRLLNLWDNFIDTTSDSVSLISYTGGPGSVLGSGNTIIRFADQRTGINNKLAKSPDYQSYFYNGTPLHAINPVGDFRANLRKTLKDPTLKNSIESGQLAFAPSYDISKNKTIEGRIHLGDPGQRAGKNYSSYTKGVTGYGVKDANSLGDNNTRTSFGDNINTSISTLGLDKVNSLPIYKSEAVDTSGITNDLVKFRIAIMDNNNPSFKTFLHFRAFLNTISDSYNAEWNATQYLGRGEKFYTYNGFTRQMALSWTVAAQSKQELIPMYKKLNYLASSLTPDYSKSGYMKGNLAQITIGGYIYEQPGIITGLTYELGEDTPWEIAIDDKGNFDPSVKELPHMIRVTGFSFIPIHTFRPEIQENQNDWKQFIAISDGIPSNKNNYGTVPPTPIRPRTEK